MAAHSAKPRRNEIIPGGFFGRLSAIDEPLPHSMKRWFWCWGSLPGFFFAIQVTTGIMLAFFYKPSPDTAFESIRFITQEVRFGWFLRSLHMWSANLMVLFVFLHATRVLVTGGNWLAPGEGLTLAWLDRVSGSRLPPASVVTQDIGEELG